MFAALLALLGWMAWIRRQYAFGKGGMMERVRQTILSSLDFDGRGSLLEVGCGSGALAVRATDAYTLVAAVVTVAVAGTAAVGVTGREHGSLGDRPVSRWMAVCVAARVSSPQPE